LGAPSAEKFVQFVAFDVPFERASAAATASAP